MSSSEWWITILNTIQSRNEWIFSFDSRIGSSELLDNTVSRLVCFLSEYLWLFSINNQLTPQKKTYNSFQCIIYEIQ